MTAKKALPAKATASGISDEAVLAKTGRRKDEWFAILDQAGARQLAHPAIVAVLLEHGVGSWWRQMVTVAYEQARGLREPNQAVSGFQMSASKTVAVPVSALYAAFANARSRARWLPKAGLAERAATLNKRIRYTGPDGRGAVEALFTARGDDKSQVTVTVTKLSDRAAMEKQKAYWKEALDRLKAQVES